MTTSKTLWNRKLKKRSRRERYLIRLNSALYHFSWCSSSKKTLKIWKDKKEQTLTSFSWPPSFWLLSTTRWLSIWARPSLLNSTSLVIFWWCKTNKFSIMESFYQMHLSTFSWKACTSEWHSSLILDTKSRRSLITMKHLFCSSTKRSKWSGDMTPVNKFMQIDSRD